MDISIGTGTADIQGFEAGEVSASAGTGSISLQGSVNSDLDLECGIGTIEFQDSGKMTDYNYSVSCGMGSIQIGDDEFTKPAGKPEYQQSCRKRNGHRVWYGKPSILHLRKESKNMEPKRLYRSRENRVLCGVCGGIAEYFNVDPVLIRLGMVLFICASVGTGLLAYFIASVIMPDQK